MFRVASPNDAHGPSSEYTFVVSWTSIQNIWKITRFIFNKYVNILTDFYIIFGARCPYCTLFFCLCWFPPTAISHDLSGCPHGSCVQRSCARVWREEVTKRLENDLGSVSYVLICVRIYAFKYVWLCVKYPSMSNVFI